MTDDIKIDFPISIALVGAPGSGKSEIATEFQRISKDWFAEQASICSCDADEKAGCSNCGNPLAIIGNSGNYLQDETDTAMGVFGGYAEDLRAYFVQYEAEDVVRRNGQSFLTLGTVLENLAHSGCTLENILTGLQTPQAEHRARAQQITMSALTFLFMERFRYTFAFYVPYAGANIVLPGADDADRAFEARVDTALRTIFVNFGFRVQPLEGTAEESAQEIFETVKRIVENGPDAPAEEIDGEVISEEEVPPLEASTLSA